MIKAGFIGFIRNGDPWENLKKAAAMGYSGMDGDAMFLPGDESLAEKAAKMRAIGIEPLTAAIFNPDRSTMAICTDEKIINATLDRAEAQGIKRITLFGSTMISSFKGTPGTYDQMMADIDAINKIVPMCAERGMFLAYHNHWQEFAEYHNMRHPIDYMLELCDPRLTLELDMGWTTVAGCDPTEVMRRLEGRIGAMHLKDVQSIERCRDHEAYRESPEEVCFTTLGTGLLDVPAVLKEMDRQGLDMAIVEQDRMRHLQHMDSLQHSILTMKETGLLG